MTKKQNKSELKEDEKTLIFLHQYRIFVKNILSE